MCLLAVISKQHRGTDAMAVRSRIGLRQVRSLKPGETIWDRSLIGFGARRQKGDAVAYVLFYRTKDGRQRWFTIGKHGAPWTPDTARAEAKRLLGAVSHHRDPAAEKRAARNAQTVAELCDLYLVDAEAGRLVTRRRTQKKASTLAIDKGRIARHIKPLLGQLRVAAVTRDDVECFMHVPTSLRRLWPAAKRALQTLASLPGMPDSVIKNISDVIAAGDFASSTLCG
jgi:Arm domain-containing DNA-binding protein